jgi:hypothetical protein
MIFFTSRQEGEITKRQYFDHTNVCGIDRHMNQPDKCIITMSNGIQLDCNSSADSVAHTICNALAEEAASPGSTTDPVQL